MTTNIHQLWGNFFSIHYRGATELCMMGFSNLTHLKFLKRCNIILILINHNLHLAHVIHTSCYNRLVWCQIVILVVGCVAIVCWISCYYVIWLLDLDHISHWIRDTTVSLTHVRTLVGSNDLSNWGTSLGSVPVTLICRGNWSNSRRLFQVIKLVVHLFLIWIMNNSLIL